MQLDAIQAVVLGIVQGLTEFLPVSSSGHLVLLPHLLNWQEQPLEFDAIIHLATLFSVLIFFKKEILLIIGSYFAKNAQAMDYRRLGNMIVIATMPSIIFGAIIQLLPQNPFRSTTVVIFNLIFWGVIMLIADYLYGKFQKIDNIKKIDRPAGIFVGLAQALALVPGTSRSGITIIAGLSRGLNRATAARFSFLLGIPAIAAAGSVSFIDLAKTGFSGVGIFPLAAGFICAFASGYLAVRFLIKFLQKHGLTAFALYRILLGLILLYFLLN